MPASPSVRIVVVSWNGAHLLEACLTSVMSQEVRGGTEVVVVDNASADGTAELVGRLFPAVRIVRAERNLGFAGGVALGVAGFDGEFVVLLNNDATFDPGAVQALVDYARAPGNERVGAVTAKVLLDGWFRTEPAGSAPAPTGAFRRGNEVLVPTGPDDPRAVRVVNSTGNVLAPHGAGMDRDWLVTEGSESGRGEVFGFCGAAAALRRSALDDVGGIDASLFLYYEDTDLSWKLRSAGWTVLYEPSAVARHRHAASSDATSPLFRYQNTRNSLLVVGRHAPAGMVMRSWLRQIGGCLAVVLRRAEPVPVRRARLRGLRDALRALPTTLRERRSLGRRASVSRRRTIDLRAA